MMHSASQVHWHCVLVTTLILLGAVNVSADEHCGADMSASMSRLESKMAMMELENRMARLENKIAQMELETTRSKKEPGSKIEPETCKPEKLENSTCTAQIFPCPDVNSNITKTLENLVEKLTDIISGLNKTNTSKNTSTVGDSQLQESDEPLVCERGMTGSENKSVILTNNINTGQKIPCDTNTDGGGWLVFMRRADGAVDFYRTWAEYREGFGNLSSDFWLGNEAIHNLTNTDDYELRIDFVINGQKKFARYSSFKLENEAAHYTLRIGSFSGTVGQAGNSGLAYSNGARFSTKDRNNNGYWQGNCAVVCQGAWWYTACHRANLLGKWASTETVNKIRWSNGNQWLVPSFIEMKLRLVASDDTS